MFQVLLFGWKEFSVFIHFIWQHAFFKYIIDKKQRRERIDCCYQLLDEVEYDILNYQNRDLICLLKPKDEGDHADTDSRFNESWFHAKTEFNNLLITRIFKKSEFANVLKHYTEEGLRNL